MCLLLQVLEFLRTMHKSDTMMLCSFSCRVAFIACVEVTEQACQQIEMPFASSHGCLVTGFLSSAKHWCVAEHNKKQVTGQLAVQALYSECAEVLVAAGKEKIIMKLAPFLQLLAVTERQKIRQLIGTMQDGQVSMKRLGSKQSLGIMKKKKLVASASASSTSGATMKIDLFD